MKAFLLAAGRGKRLLPFTLDNPKPLIKIGGLSLIERNIENVSPDTTLLPISTHSSSDINELKTVAEIMDLSEIDNSHGKSSKSEIVLPLFFEHQLLGFFKLDHKPDFHNYIYEEFRLHISTALKNSLFV